MKKILILLKNVDGGTGTYLEGLLGLSNLYPSGNLGIKVLVLEKPRYRTQNVNSYTYFPRKSPIANKYNLNLYNLITLLREVLWFRREVEKFSPEIVMSSDSHSIIITEAAKYIYRFKYMTIDVIHNNLKKVTELRLSPNLRHFFNYIFGLLLRRSGAVVSVSEDLSSDLYNDYKLKNIPHTIPAILPFFSFKTGLVNNFNKKIVITVARLDRQKDHETLLRAFKPVSEKNKDAKLWIVGDGPLKKHLVSMAKKLGMNKQVKFLGWKQNPTQYLDKSSVFVLSSKWEGFPLSLLEAMSRGLPVIASDCKYGPEEILNKNKYGILVPVGDYKNMSDAITSLLSNNSKFIHYSHMAKKRFSEYSRDKMLLMYKNIIDNFSIA